MAAILLEVDLIVATVVVVVVPLHRHCFVPCVLGEGNDDVDDGTIVVQQFDWCHIWH